MNRCTTFPSSMQEEFLHRNSELILKGRIDVVNKRLNIFSWTVDIQKISLKKSTRFISLNVMINIIHNFWRWSKKRSFIRREPSSDSYGALHCSVGTGSEFRIWQTFFKSLNQMCCKKWLFYHHSSSQCKESAGKMNPLNEVIFYWNLLSFTLSGEKKVFMWTYETVFTY